MSSTQNFGGLGAVIGVFIAIVSGGGIVTAAVCAAIIGGLFAGACELWDFYRKRKIANYKMRAAINISQQETSATSETSVNDPVDNVTPYYYGFGGWLYVFAISQIYTVFNLYTGSKDMLAFLTSGDLQTIRDEGLTEYANKLIYLSLGGIIISVIAFLSIIITWIFAIRVSRFYKQSNIIYILINTIGGIILISYMFYLDYYIGEKIFITDELIGTTIGGGVFALVWIPYFMKSERVRNTFTK